MTLVQRIKTRMRSRVGRELDDALSSHYVRQQQVAQAVEELRRLLEDRFDAETEAIAIIGQRISALEARLDELREEIASSRARA